MLLTHPALFISVLEIAIVHVFGVVLLGHAIACDGSESAHPCQWPAFVFFLLGDRVRGWRVGEGSFLDVLLRDW